MKNMQKRLLKAALDSGFFQAGIIETASVRCHDEVRRICEGNTCRNYGATWACPPAVGTIAECAKRVNAYKSLLLFSQKYALEDSFDFEGMQSAWRDFKHLTDTFHASAEVITADFILMSNEGCGRCKVCTYPDAPCRFPEMLHPSLEGYGFIVSDLAKSAGMNYINGKDTVTYFGGLLFDHILQQTPVCIYRLRSVLLY